MFLTCVDRMAWVWMGPDADELLQDCELSRLKTFNVALNESALNRAIEARNGSTSDNLSKHLIEMETPLHWLDAKQLSGLNF